jgi:hypothetical protein
MSVLFIIFLIIDILAAIFLFRLAFIQRSNMNWKYKRRFTFLVTIIVAALSLRFIHLTAACIIAGVPATLMSLFVIGLAIAMFSHKGNWR